MPFSIEPPRSRVLRAVDVIQVHTCGQVGWYIVQFEQGGAACVAYGQPLLSLPSE